MASTVEDYDIVGSYNNLRTSGVDVERTINLFEYIDPLGKKPKSLLSTSGLLNTDKTFVDSQLTDGFRGQFVLNNFMYVVIGRNVYSISLTGIVNKINTNLLALPPTGYVGIEANTRANPQVIFVDGQQGYIWDTGALTWTQITDSSFPTRPIDVTFLDGFFIVIDGTTPNFYLSSLNNGLVWGPSINNITTPIPNTLTIGTSTIGGPATSQNYQTGVAVQLTATVFPPGLNSTTTYYSIFVDATHIQLSLTPGGPAIVFGGGITAPATVISLGQLQTAAISTHPGTLVACKTLHRRLFLFSQNYYEVWENAGLGVNLPFRRNNSLLGEVGTPAIASVKAAFDKLFFLSQDKGGLGSVMMIDGTQSIPISTKALDTQLAAYNADPALGVSDATGIVIKERGLIFYRLNFTRANATYVYDVTLSNATEDAAKLWHEEQVLTGDRHLAQTQGFFNGLNYYGSYKAPILYISNAALFTNDGEQMRRTRIGRPVVVPPYQRRRIDRFQLDLLQGTIQLITYGEEEIFLLADDSKPILTSTSHINITLSQTNTSVPIIQHPVVYLSISKDSGQSYGNSLVAPMGELGERTFRTVWRKLGVTPRGQAFVPKIEFFVPSPFIVLGAAWAFEILPE